MKTTLKALLFVAVGVMGYLCVMSILRPIQFAEAKQKRDRAVIKRLIDIRTAQVAYMNEKGEYTAKFDTLIQFLNNNELKFLVKVGSLTEEQMEGGLTEIEAVKKGIIKRDTYRIIAKDTLFPKGFNVDSIRFVPGTNQEFNLGINLIPTSTGVWMPVFEAATPFEVYLNGLDRQEIINLKEKAEDFGKYPGLKVGSTIEINNNAGNWEF